MNNIIITQLKNQSNRIKDWILYHYAEGFDGFIIFDDFSEDSTEEEIIKIRDKFNINIIVKKTDGLGNSYGLMACKDSNSYGGDSSLSDRILRTINTGYEMAYNINPNSFCAFIDVDEFIMTNSDKKVTDVIHEKFGLNYKQIQIRNIDVLHNYELTDWYTNNIDLKTWNYEDLRNHEVWKYRNKAVLKTGFCKLLKFIHCPCQEGDKESYTYIEDDFNELRLLHFRTPNLDTMRWESDDIASKKFKQIYEKYGDNTVK